MAFVKIAPLPERKARVAALKAGAMPKKCPECGGSFTGIACPACGYNGTKGSPSQKAMQERKKEEKELGKSVGGND